MKRTALVGAINCDSARVRLEMSPSARVRSERWRPGGTPTRQTLKHLGEQYKRLDQTNGRYNVVQYACQRNNALALSFRTFPCGRSAEMCSTSNG